MKLTKALKKQASIKPKDKMFSFRVENEIVEFLKKHNVDIADLCRFSMNWKMRAIKENK